METVKRLGKSLTPEELIKRAVKPKLESGEIWFELDKLTGKW